jgi:hypothetical protein
LDYKQLKSSIKEIAEIATSVPEPFRNKCFEVLLNSLLAEQRPASAEDASATERLKQAGPAKEQAPDAPTSIPMTAQLRVLMSKTGVSEEELKKVVLVTDGEVHFIKEPQPKKVTEGQMQWSLLLALKNAILKNSMTTDPEEVRSKCQDAGFYDKANFARNFKMDKIAKLFKGSLVPQGQAVALSSEGQDALGQLLKALAGEAQ